MPSFSHDGLVRLFRNRPELAVDLLRDVLGVEVPAYVEARIESADVSDIEPAARYADLVVLLVDGAPVLGIIIEVQLDVDDDKPFRWPAYLTNLRAGLRCPVELIVVTPSARVARWAARPIPIGRGVIQPLVIGPGGVPAIDDPDAARSDLELAVLSAMAHGQGPVEVAVPIAVAVLAAAAGCPDDRALLYSDLTMAALSEAARAALEELMRTEGYEYQSEFARRHRAEGEALGEARALLMVLDARDVELTAEQRDRIMSETDLAQLEAWLRKAATVSSADELFR